MRRSSPVGFLLAALLLLVPALAWAQETTGSISGTVVQSSGAAVGNARISVASDRGTREVTADDQGRFLLAFLTPGAYTLTVSAEGFGSVKDDVTVGLGQRISRRYQLAPVMQESMDVVAPAEEVRPVIDMTVQQTGSSIPTEIAEQLPLQRNISSVVFLAPGVKSGGGTGSANPSISGSSGLENQYVFDGVNVTNAGFGALGGYSIIHGSQGTGINFNFVEETQVITGGFAAEYGQAMGGIVNVVTKSGTNEWNGSLYGFWQPDSLEATRLTPMLDTLDVGPTLGFDRLDFGADIGGPIVKDHVFFWMGVNPQRATTTRRAPYRDRDGDGVADYALYDEGDIERVDKSTSWAGKFTFQINPDHRIDLSAFGDPTESNNTFTRGSTTLSQPDRRQFSSIDYGYENFSLKYQGQVTPNFLIDAQVATAKNTFDEKFAPQYDTNRIIDFIPLLVNGDPLLFEGGIGFFEKTESKNDQFNIKFTNIIGKHELKYGFGVEDISFDAITDRTGPGAIKEDGTYTATGTTAYRYLATEFGLDPLDPGFNEPLDTDGDGVIDDAAVYYVLRGVVTDPAKETSSDYEYAFIQDSWAITPNFNLDFGLRWERQSVNGEEIQYTFPSEISPRIGFSWDHTGEGRAKIYGHAGRFYEKIPLDLAVRVFSPETNVDALYYDREQTELIPGTYTEIGGEADGVIPGTRNSYTDEFVLGYQRTLGGQERWKFKGELVYREIGRILEDVAVNADPAVCDGIIDGSIPIGSFQDLVDVLEPGSESDGLLGDATTCGYLMGNIEGADLPGGLGSFPDPERKYKAAVFEVTRQADERWFLTLQYVLSSLRGNYEGLFRNDNLQSDPNLTSLYDYADEGIFYATSKSGPLNTDRPHRFQAFGFYNWESGWFVNGRGTIQSGVPVLELASHPVYGNQGEVQLDRRGSLGRTSTEWNLDAGFGYKFDLNTNYESAITLSLDVFNVFNHTYGNSYDFDADLASTVEDPADYDELLDQVANGDPNPDYGRATTYSNPRQFRFGVRWTF